MKNRNNIQGTVLCFTTKYRLESGTFIKGRGMEIFGKPVPHPVRAI